MCVHDIDPAEECTRAHTHTSPQCLGLFPPPFVFINQTNAGVHSSFSQWFLLQSHSFHLLSSSPFSLLRLFIILSSTPPDEPRLSMHTPSALLPSFILLHSCLSFQSFSSSFNSQPSFLASFFFSLSLTHTPSFLILPINQFSQLPFFTRDYSPLPCHHF